MGASKLWLIPPAIAAVMYAAYAAHYYRDEPWRPEPVAAPSPKIAKADVPQAKPPDPIPAAARVAPAPAAVQPPDPCVGWRDCALSIEDCDVAALIKKTPCGRARAKLFDVCQDVAGSFMKTARTTIDWNPKRAALADRAWSAMTGKPSQIARIAREEKVAAKARGKEIELQEMIRMSREMHEWTDAGGGAAFQVDGAKYVQSLGDHYFTGDGAFLAVTVTVANRGTQRLHANPTQFTVTVCGNRDKTLSTETYGIDGYLDAVNLEPGSETTGRLVFEVPKSCGIRLNWQRSFAPTASKSVYVLK